MPPRLILGGHSIHSERECRKHTETPSPRTNLARTKLEMS